MINIYFMKLLHRQLLNRQACVEISVAILLKLGTWASNHSRKVPDRVPGFVEAHMSQWEVTAGYLCRKNFREILWVSNTYIWVIS